jgi:peptide/nickel transport system substrate-binding protein
MVSWLHILGIAVLALIIASLLIMPHAALQRLSSMTFCIPSPGKLAEFNPYFYIASPPLTHGMVMKFVYETLAEERADGSIEPLLATQWSASQDGRAITIKLRPNVVWHDGRPFTSRDVAFVISTIMKYPQGDVYNIRGYIESVETPDQLTVVIKLSQPFSRFLYYLLTGYRIFPEHVFSGQDMSNFPARDPSYIVGTGPYRLVEANFDTQIFRLRAFDKYWGGAPQIGEIVIQIVDESAPIPVMLKTGQCSIAAITNPALVSPLTTEPSLRVATAKGWPYQGSYYTPAGLLVLNTALYPFNSTAFRQALAYAIDKNRIVQLALQGFGEVASSGQLPMSSKWRPPDLPEISFNTTKAREILRSLGFVEGSDGLFRYPNGSLLSIKIIHTGGLASNVVPLIIQDWRRAGIDATEEVMTRLTYVNNLAYGYYQVAMLLTNRPLDVDFILTVFMDRNPSPTPIGQSVQYWGWTRYVNQEFNSLIMQARLATREEDSYRFYADAQRIAARDQWVIPLYYSKAIWIFNVKDYTGWDPLYSGEGFPSRPSLMSVKPYTPITQAPQTLTTMVQVTTIIAPVGQQTVTSVREITVTQPVQAQEIPLWGVVVAAAVIIAVIALVGLTYMRRRS